MLGQLGLVTVNSALFTVTSLVGQMLTPGNNKGKFQLNSGQRMRLIKKV